MLSSGSGHEVGASILASKARPLEDIFLLTMGRLPPRTVFSPFGCGAVSFTVVAERDREGLTMDAVKLPSLFDLVLSLRMFLLGLVLGGRRYGGCLYSGIIHTCRYLPR